MIITTNLKLEKSKKRLIWFMHVIACTVDNIAKHKYNDCKRSYYRIRQLSDELCWAKIGPGFLVISTNYKQSLRRWSRRKRNCSTLFHNFFIVRYNGAILTTNLTDPGEKFENIPDVCKVSDLMEVFVGDAAYSSKFPVTFGSKRRYKTTEEGQQVR